MELIFLPFPYNPTKTNLTNVGIKISGDKQTIMSLANADNRLILNINAFSGMSHMKNLDIGDHSKISGSISICFANMNRFVYGRIGHALPGYNNSYGIAWNAQGQATGNINVFADKYDFYGISCYGHRNITGELKSLKNLKKFAWYNFESTGITGSNADLWNNGANFA